MKILDLEVIQMSIDHSDFDSVSEADIREIVDNGVPEGLRVEYKQGVYGRTDENKRELLKDVSAFANTNGGHLILGIEENNGVATNLVGVGDIDFDAELARMEQILRSGLEPIIQGVRIRSIPFAGGARVIVVRIPKSWNPPHRVIAQASNRFYIRHSAGVHEPSVGELRTLFTQTTSALDNARRYRDERLHQIILGQGVRPLLGDGRIILHIIPVAAFSGTISIDLEEA